MAPTNTTPGKPPMRLTRARARLGGASSIMGGLNDGNRSTERLAADAEAISASGVRNPAQQPAERIRVIIHTPQSRHRARIAALEARLDVLRKRMDLVVAIEHAREMIGINNRQKMHRHRHRLAKKMALEHPSPPPSPPRQLQETQLPAGQSWNLPDWDGDSKREILSPPLSPRSLAPQPLPAGEVDSGETVAKEEMEEMEDE
ncbi:hypothetical protein GQ602_002877 [Ophiocordyceps camponoti-floridani]|uniref:Uncharacterized protein n=1 Tax=Ophiocordyceps camponoti-floridani TaxID=2030778 RepID=A0A8H4QB61_9HYPO|nr:hypothetical protein GQ602_002877 [Ophiocordyceps camponoti-floridani]